MSTLEHEQALLFDRDLKRKLTALGEDAPAEAWVKAAEALTERSLPYLAQEITEKGLALYPSESELWMIHIKAAAISAERLQSCLKALTNPAEPPEGLQILLALVEYFIERDKQGLSRLEAIPEEGRNAMYFEVCGYYAMARQEFGQAVKFFTRARRKAPSRLRLMYHLGKSYYAAGDTEKAVHWLYRVVAKERHYVKAWNALCRIHLAEGDLGRARQAYGMALSVNPRDWGLYFTYADHYLGRCRYAMARAILDEVLDMAPRDIIASEVHNYRGYLFYVEGNYADALPCFQRALDLNPALAVAWFNLGNLHFHLKDMEQAQFFYGEALRVDPNMSSAWCQLGLTYLEQGLLNKAAAPLERALALDPGDYWAHMGLSEYYRRTRTPSTALEEARQALRIAPDDANVHNYLGIALETNRRYFDAEKAYKKALKLDPAHRWAANNLGYLYEKIMRLDPSYKDAAVDAWKRRLLICRDTKSSVRGAINHLKKLGVSSDTIQKWLNRDPSDRSKRKKRR